MTDGDGREMKLLAHAAAATARRGAAPTKLVVLAALAAASVAAQTTTSTPTTTRGTAQRGQPTGHALLLGTQRTGTTWAMAELGRSPCVQTTSELFIQFVWKRDARMACLGLLYGDAAAGRSKCSAKFRAFLDKSSSFAAKNNATGLPSISAFKWMQSVEKDWDWLKVLWKRYDVKIITLRRRDHVRTLLSRVTNRKTGLAHPTLAQIEHQAKKRVTLRTSPKVLLRHLRVIERSYQELGRFHQKVVKAGIAAKMVYYEDLVDDPRARDRLRAFALGAAAGEPRCAAVVQRDTVHRIHAKALVDEISNYAQVKQALSKTKFAKFLDADEAARVAPPPRPHYDASEKERTAGDERKRVAAVEERTAQALAVGAKEDEEYSSTFLAELRAKAIASMHALLETDAADDDDA